MKLMFFICFLFNFLNADSLLSYNYRSSVYTKCIKEYSFYEYKNSSYLYFTQSDDIKYSLNLSSISSYEILDGYEYLNNECQLKNDLKISSMTNEQYTLLMILLANFGGLSIVLPFSILIARS